MRRNDLRAAFFAAFGAGVAVLASCDAGDEGPPELPPPCDRVGNPDFTGPGHGAIGPAGGVVEETDPSSPIAGVRVEVARGAWSECWEVRIGYATIFSTPDYPSGYVPFERPGPSGAVEIEIGLSTTTGFYRAQDPLPIQISFPLANIRPEILEIGSAFFYDHLRQTWRIAFPDGVTRERLTVATSAHDELWSWGRVNFGDVDFDQHVKPALESYYGNETLAGIQTALDEIRRQAEAQKWAITCAGLAAGEAFFATARDSAAENIEEIQASLGCGPCNPLSDRFQEELEEWWQVAQWDIANDFAGIFFMRSAGDVLQVALTPLIKDQQEWLQCLFDLVGCVLIDPLYPDTLCDYECYFERVPSLQMNVNKGVYYGCDWIRGIVDRYRTRMMSPPCR